MATYQVIVTVDGRFNRPGQLTKAIRTALGESTEQITIDISKEENVTNYRSRAHRFGIAASDFEGIVGEVSNLIEELESWRDNMPDSLQGGTKGSEIDEALEPLQSLKDELDEISWPEVEFPGQ